MSFIQLIMVRYFRSCYFRVSISFISVYCKVSAGLSLFESVTVIGDSREPCRACIKLPALRWNGVI